MLCNKRYYTDTIINIIKYYTNIYKYYIKYYTNKIHYNKRYYSVKVLYNLILHSLSIVEWLPECIAINRQNRKVIKFCRAIIWNFDESNR